MAKILLHCCCAPCSVSCLEPLKNEGVDVTAFWFNPNIHPFKEYEARRNCLVDFMDEQKIPLIIKEDYGLRKFVKNVADDIEGRCVYCYCVRLEETAKYARDNGFDGFTSTLFASIYQDHDLMVKKAEELAKKYGVKFYYRDFRPNFREGNQKARDMGLYMQKYCGCIFSEEDRYKKQIDRLKGMSLSYKNYIFDFGRVIVHFEPEDLTAKYIKDTKDIALAKEVIFDRLYWDRLDEGTITNDEVINGIKERLPEYLHENALNAYNNWYRNLDFIEGMPQLIRKIKDMGGKLYLLSNISNTFAENYKTVPKLKKIFDLFDGLVFSAPTGLVKPNKEIFEHLINKYKLNKNECIFIDDNKENVLSAENVGIKAFLFKGNSKELEKNI